MQSNQIIKLKTKTGLHLQRWVFLLIMFHGFIWTFVPSWVRYSLPMDALEGATWGQQLEWGYDKNPFMNGWLTALAVKITEPTGWGVYLFSQLSVMLSCWAVWELGKKVLPPRYAFIAVIMLFALQYFNLHAIDFNDNTLELGLWAGTCLFYYEALQKGSIRNWGLTALFAGLSMMTKYYVVMLLIPMFFFMLLYPFTRAHFKRWPFYFGLITFFVIVAPHCFWLFNHHFVTVNYAFQRVSSESSWLNHLYYPALFAWQQIEVFVPALILFAFLLVGKNKKSNLSCSLYNRIFLLFIGLGPFLLTILLSALTGIKLRAGWGQPLLTFWPLLILAWTTPELSPNRSKYFNVLLGLIFIVTPISYSAALMRAEKPSSANFPGKIIADALDQKWHQTFHSPLQYVVGPRWLSGNISFYSVDHPRVYMEANKLFSPWIDENQLKKTGALFVWDPTEEFQISYESLKARFAQLQPLQTLHFNWLRNQKMSPVEVRVAWLPPEQYTGIYRI